MTPEQKARLALFLKGLALAMLAAGVAFATAHWTDVFGYLPYGIFGAMVASFF